MKIQTKVKAGGITLNHNQKSGLKVRTNVKSGGLTLNHNKSGLKSARV
jgi:hypothetical protein